MKRQWSLAVGELRSEGVEQFGRSAALVSGLTTIGLFLIICMSSIPTRVSWAVLSRNRVSYVTQISTRAIKGLRVAHVCRIVAGLQPPSPMDNRSALVSREESTGEERWGLDLLT